MQVILENSLGKYYFKTGVITSQRINFFFRKKLFYILYRLINYKKEDEINAKVLPILN